MAGVNTIEHLVVAVPANNEEGSLSGCLTRIGTAVEALLLSRPDIATIVCVGLDRCTDRSEVVVGEHGAFSVSTDTPGVGAAQGELDATRAAHWRDLHDLVEGHPHVHGANLGIRGSHWRAVGGFGDLTLHEDAGVVARVRAGTERWVATDTVRVRTSGRLSSRVHGGFATFLSRLDPVT